MLSAFESIKQSKALRMVQLTSSKCNALYCFIASNAESITHGAIDLFKVQCFLHLNRLNNRTHCAWCNWPLQSAMLSSVSLLRMQKALRMVQPTSSKCNALESIAQGAIDLFKVQCALLFHCFECRKHCTWCSRPLQRAMLSPFESIKESKALRMVQLASSKCHAL